MFDIHRVELDWGGRKLTLETGKVARQADGAVIATYGETTVIALDAALTSTGRFPALDLVASGTLRPGLLTGDVIGLEGVGPALAAMDGPGTAAGMTVVSLAE